MWAKPCRGDTTAAAFSKQPLPKFWTSSTSKSEKNHPVRNYTHPSGMNLLTTITTWPFKAKVLLLGLLTLKIRRGPWRGKRMKKRSTQILSKKFLTFLKVRTICPKKRNSHLLPPWMTFIPLSRKISLIVIIIFCSCTKLHWKKEKGGNRPWPWMPAAIKLTDFWFPSTKNGYRSSTRIIDKTRKKQNPTPTFLADYKKTLSSEAKSKIW